MVFALRRWRWRHLFAAWVTYWVGLLGVTFGSFAEVAWRIARLPEGHHSSVSAGIENAVAHLTATSDGATVWNGSAHLGTIAFWIAGPPLALWLLWLSRRPSRAPDSESDTPPARTSAMLGAERAAIRGAAPAGFDGTVTQRRDEESADRSVDRR